MAKQRIEVLGVPVDIISPQNIESEIMELLAKPGTKQIVFLNIWELLKARGKNDFSLCVHNADLVIPVSKSIIKGAKFLKKQTPIIYNPFDAVISILSVLENHYRSLYLLGGHKKSVMAAEKNVRKTFRGLQIVGRYVGYYPKSVENDVIQAIYKASPSLVLVSDGIREKNCWSYNRRNQFASSIFLYYHDAIGIFSERVKRISDKTFKNGHVFWHELIRNPLKIFYVFPYIRYIMLLFWYRVTKK